MVVFGWNFYFPDGDSFWTWRWEYMGIRELPEAAGTWEVSSESNNCVCTYKSLSNSDTSKEHYTSYADLDKHKNVNVKLTDCTNCQSPNSKIHT